MSIQARKNQPKATLVTVKAAWGQERRGKRESRVDQAYAEIRRRILDNHYAPGHHVLEQELAADLGMSRTPVREALVRLQNERFRQLIPRHGMRVVPSRSGAERGLRGPDLAQLTAIERLARADLDEDALAAIESHRRKGFGCEKKDVDAGPRRRALPSHTS